MLVYSTVDSGLSITHHCNGIVTADVSLRNSSKSREWPITYYSRVWGKSHREASFFGDTGTGISLKYSER